MVLARTAQLPTGDIAGARASLEAAVALADERGGVRAAAEGEALLADVLHADGDVAGAYRHLQRSCRLSQQRRKSAHDQRVRPLRARLEGELAERDAQRYRAQAQAQAAGIAELGR